MAAASWLLMLFLVQERPVGHLPISSNDSPTDAAAQQLGKKVSQHMVIIAKHSQFYSCCIRTHRIVFIGECLTGEF